MRTAVYNAKWLLTIFSTRQNSTISGCPLPEQIIIIIINRQFLTRRNTTD